MEVEIEEIVLQGYPLADRRAVARAVERELARLFAERGLPPELAGGGDIPHIDAGGFEASPQSGGEEIGAQVARSVYGGLKI
jgi:hypothetical protein